MSEQLNFFDVLDCKRKHVLFGALEKYQDEYEKIMDSNSVMLCANMRNAEKSGFVINGGSEYYCSEKCLHKHYSEEDYLEMYDDGDGESYWTEFDDDDGGCTNTHAFEIKSQQDKQ